jgi:hypothetical protein
MEAVIHARSQPQRDILAVAIEVDSGWIEQQLVQRVRKSLRLDQLVTMNAPGRADDRVAGAGHHAWIGVDGTGARFQFSGEAGVQTTEVFRLRLTQIEISKQPPDRDRRSG